jgi:hypothetical protein
MKVIIYLNSAKYEDVSKVPYEIRSKWLSQLGTVRVPLDPFNASIELESDIELIIGDSIAYSYDFNARYLKRLVELSLKEQVNYLSILDMTRTNTGTIKYLIGAFISEGGG